MAIWLSFQRIPNQPPGNFSATPIEMVGFTVFWLASSLSVAKGVASVFYKVETVSATSRWSVSWLMMAGPNQAIGQKAAGMVNGSEFPRYFNAPSASSVASSSTAGPDDGHDGRRQRLVGLSRATFVTVISSFSVFLAPLIDVMTCDYFVVRRQKIRLNHLYYREGSEYWSTRDVNWQVLP
ncbi:hypothetical protein PspLS_11982 [Pyricularia sp. CBS 133598]|nr:hypothetical protein PspLS_11982 [Pyricularia sp. CBS 133598]